MNRNDPCPCGSGKKYKKCCLQKGQEMMNARLGLSLVMERAHREILEYATSRWGQDLLLTAMKDFATEGAGIEFEFADSMEDTDELTLFMNWFLFQFNPPNIAKSDYEELDQQWLESKIDYYTPTIAQQALKYAGDSFSAEAKDYIEQELKSCYTFLQINSTDTSSNITRAFDLAAGREVSFKSSPIMLEIKPGHIIFGKVITFNGAQFLEPMADAIFNPDVKSEIVPFASELYSELSRPRIRDERVAVSESMLWHYGMLRT
jgi:hypothetical protein